MRGFVGRSKKTRAKEGKEGRSAKLMRGYFHKGQDIENLPPGTRPGFAEIELWASRDPVVMRALYLYQFLFEQVYHPDLVKVDDKFQSTANRILRDHNFNSQVIERSPTHLVMWGNALTQRMGRKGKVDTYITRDITRFDFIRDNYSDVSFNNYGMPIGFEDVDASVSVWSRIAGGHVYKMDEDMFHFAIHQRRSLDWGYGFVEPIFQFIKQNYQMRFYSEENAEYFGDIFPIISYKVDSANQMDATDGETKAKAMMEQLLSIKYPNEERTVGIIHPEHIKAEMFSDKFMANTFSQIEDHTRWNENEMSAFLGIPIPIMFMTLKDQPKTALEDLCEFFELNLRYVAKHVGVARMVEDYITSWKPAAETEVVVEYPEFLTKTRKEKIMRLFRMGKKELFPLTPKAQKQIMEWLDFSPDVVQDAIKSLEKEVGSETVEVSGHDK